MTDVPHMASQGIFDSMEAVGAGWTGQGVAVECGTWLGGTLAPLCRGLNVAGYDRQVHCFDRWKPNLEEVGKAARFGIKLEVGQDITPLMLANVQPIYGAITPHRGRIELADWIGGPIEIFVLDGAKRNPSFNGGMGAFRGAFIPGVTTLCLLDWGFYESIHDKRRSEFEVQRRFTEANAASLESLTSLDSGSARFFKVTGELELVE